MRNFLNIYLILTILCSAAIKLNSISLEIQNLKNSRNIQNEINLIEEEKVTVGTCTAQKKKGVFGFNGKCYGGKEAKDFFANIKFPKSQKDSSIQDTWDEFIAPVIKVFPANIVPSGCMGDFSTDKLLSDKNSLDAHCGNFPIPKEEKMSAIGFSIKNVICVEPVDVEICAIFDKCGTFGISMSGGTIACFTAATGIGAMLAPIAGSADYLQFGYSPKRLWTADMEFLDPEDNLNVKKVTLRSHVYLGASFTIPKCGIKFNDKDVTEIFAVTMSGKAYIDFGNKNDYTKKNMRALINDTDTKPSKKIDGLLAAAREYSFQARGSFSLNLSGITNNILPDLVLADKLDLNILANLGKGPDGDYGSSGLQEGLHIFIRPPPMDILGKFIESIVDNLGKIMKCGEIPVPEIPKLEGVELGFTLGKMIGFKMQIKNFSIQCLVKTEDGLAVSCKIGLDVLSVFSDAGKWIAKMGKELFDKAGEKLAEFAQAAGDFFEDIGEGAKKFMNNLVDGAKVALEKVSEFKEKVKEKAKEAVKKFGDDCKKIKDKADKAVKKAVEKTKAAFKKIGKKFDGAIKKAGAAIKDLGKKILKIFNRKKYEANLKAEKAKKIKYEKAKLKEKLTAEKLQIKEKLAAAKLEKIELIAAEKLKKKAEDDEKDAEEEEEVKNSAYLKALQRQLDL